MPNQSYASEIQSEALKAVGARYRRDIRLMMYLALGLFGVLIVLLAVSLNDQSKMSKELADQQIVITNQQTHSRELLNSNIAQTKVLEEDIQCVANLFASDTPGTITITDLQTCQTSSQPNGISTSPSNISSTSVAQSSDTNSPKESVAASTTPTPAPTTSSTKPVQSSTTSSPGVVQRVLNFLGGLL